MRPLSHHTLRAFGFDFGFGLIPLGFCFSDVAG